MKIPIPPILKQFPGKWMPNLNYRVCDLYTWQSFFYRPCRLALLHIRYTWTCHSGLVSGLMWRFKTEGNGSVWHWYVMLSLIFYYQTQLSDLHNRWSGSDWYVITWCMSQCWQTTLSNYHDHEYVIKHELEQKHTRHRITNTSIPIHNFLSVLNRHMHIMKSTQAHTHIHRATHTHTHTTRPKR